MTPDVAAPLLRLRFAALVAGVIAAVAATPGAFLQPATFFPAYLTAYLFWWGIACGSLALSMLYHMTGGGWGTAIRRPLEASCGTLPLLAALFVPVLFGLPVLYLWARPDAVALDASLKQKALYLNVPFFAARAASYFAIWIVLAWFNNRWSALSRFGGESQSINWLVALSGPGMILWALTVTFAAIDWSMSLDPHWLSSIYGVIFMAGQAVSALAFALVIITCHRQHPLIAKELDESRWHDLGNLLMAFMLFWTYVSFTQYLVIWSGNLPEETGWFLRRGQGGWQWVALLLICLHFVVPFAFLLHRAVKRDPRGLLALSLLLLTMRFVDFCWQVLPTFYASASLTSFNWLTVCTFLAIGGLWLAAFAHGLTSGLSDLNFQTQSVGEVHHG